MFALPVTPCSVLRSNVYGPNGVIASYVIDKKSRRYSIKLNFSFSGRPASGKITHIYIYYWNRLLHGAVYYGGILPGTIIDPSWLSPWRYMHRDLFIRNEPFTSLVHRPQYSQSYVSYVHTFRDTPLYLSTAYCFGLQCADARCHHAGHSCGGDLPTLRMSCTRHSVYIFFSFGCMLLLLSSMIATYNTADTASACINTTYTTWKITRGRLKDA